MEKDRKNYVAKVVGQNEDGKDVVQIYRLLMEGNKLEYAECKDIKPLDWDVARKQFSVVARII